MQRQGGTRYIYRIERGIRALGAGNHLSATEGKRGELRAQTVKAQLPAAPSQRVFTYCEPSWGNGWRISLHTALTEGLIRR